MLPKLSVAMLSARLGVEEAAVIAAAFAALATNTVAVLAQSCSDYGAVLPLVILRSEMIMEKCPSSHLLEQHWYAVIAAHAGNSRSSRSTAGAVKKPQCTIY